MIFFCKKKDIEIWNLLPIIFLWQNSSFLSPFSLPLVLLPIAFLSKKSFLYQSCFLFPFFHLLVREKIQKEKENLNVACKQIRTDYETVSKKNERLEEDVRSVEKRLSEVEEKRMEMEKQNNQVIIWKKKEEKNITIVLFN